MNISNEAGEFLFDLVNVRSQFRNLPHESHVEIVFQLRRPKVGGGRTAIRALQCVRAAALARQGVFEVLPTKRRFLPLRWA